MNEPPVDLQQFWNGIAHPDEIGHELYADLAKYAILRILAHVERSKAAKLYEGIEKVGEDRNITLRNCALPKVPYTSMQAVQDFCYKDVISTNLLANGDSFAASQVSGSWRNYEDIPNKPGWNAYDLVSDGVTASTITFNVTLGKRKRIEVTYLRSYFNMTFATMKIDGCQESYQLDGVWETRMSLPFRFVLGVSESQKLSNHLNSATLRSNLGCNVQPGQSLRVSFTLAVPPSGTSGIGRFKLLSIMSC